MRLLAISDLHIGHPANRQALEAISARPDDWLILAGDIGETEQHLRFCFDLLGPRFAKLIWVPGNHELWTIATEPEVLRGEAKYRRLVDLARGHAVVTPEDPFPLWQGSGGPCLLAPLFLLYDYSFRPPEVPAGAVCAWAAEANILPADERLLSPTPHASRAAWCHARIEETAARLAAKPAGLPTVLINHYPLRRDLVRLPRVPRFSPWCGTVLTEDWHRRFEARAAVHGHLHVRRTDWRDGTRFEEVSLGYPRQWDAALGIEHYLREILPGPRAPV